MIGESASFRAVLEQVDLVAAADCAVLIQGETGTGKELVARAIHDESLRRSGPFITLNCAAMPGGLIESELFGHERGAFTGAWAQTTGRFQMAHQGTLFLDEIGDLPLELQPKLLRVLQEQEFERLGGTRTIRVDVRVVAATNQNLERMVAERRFRADLFYRLNVFPIEIPPLRERIEDIPALVRRFVHEAAGRMDRTIDEIPEPVMEALSRYNWPGNIRELQNLVERAVVLTEGRVLHPPLAAIHLAEKTPRIPPRRLTRLNPPARWRKRSACASARRLQKTNWVIGGRAGAAAKLGLPRTTLIARMRKLGISRPAEPADENSHPAYAPAAAL